MSGSSCDGIDAVLVRIKGAGPELVMKLVAFQTYAYDDDFRNRLLNEHLHAKDICLLNFEMGERLAEAANKMIAIAEEEGLEVDLIASHGHTIAHYPPGVNTAIGTLQIGEAAVLAERTRRLVVSDFRPRDMAAGGQGAPLVPYADWLLFKKLDRTIACLNIGGIANFTVVSPNYADVFAFDTGPANMAIDGVVRLLTQGESQFDQHGRAAARGMIIDEFHEYLLSHPYFALEPPKSTGREDFGTEVYLWDAIASRRDHTFDDLVATVTSAVAQSICDAYLTFIEPRHNIEQLIVGGGGAMNKTLMAMIRKRLPKVKVFTSDQYGIPHGAREAIAFAILGNETICGRPSNIPQATGANRPVLLGNLTLP